MPPKKLTLNIPPVLRSNHVTRPLLKDLGDIADPHAKQKYTVRRDSFQHLPQVYQSGLKRYIQKTPAQLLAARARRAGVSVAEQREAERHFNAVQRLQNDIDHMPRRNSREQRDIDLVRNSRVPADHALADEALLHHAEDCEEWLREHKDAIAEAKHWRMARGGERKERKERKQKPRKERKEKKSKPPKAKPPRPPIADDEEIPYGEVPGWQYHIVPEGQEPELPLEGVNAILEHDEREREADRQAGRQPPPRFGLNDEDIAAGKAFLVRLRNGAIMDTDAAYAELQRLDDLNRQFVLHKLKSKRKGKLTLMEQYVRGVLEGGGSGSRGEQPEDKKEGDYVAEWRALKMDRPLAEKVANTDDLGVRWANMDRDNWSIGFQGRHAGWKVVVNQRALDTLDAAQLRDWMALINRIRDSYEGEAKAALFKFAQRVMNQLQQTEHAEPEPPGELDDEPAGDGDDNGMEASDFQQGDVEIVPPAEERKSRFGRVIKPRPPGGRSTGGGGHHARGSGSGLEPPSKRQKRENPWVQHVKDYARKNNISYAYALTDPTHRGHARASYYGGTFQTPDRRDLDVMMLPSTAEMQGGCVPCSSKKGGGLSVEEWMG